MGFTVIIDNTKCNKDVKKLKSRFRDILVFLRKESQFLGRKKFNSIDILSYAKLDQVVKYSCKFNCRAKKR